MWFLRVSLLASCIVVYGDCLIPKPSESDVEIPDFVHEYMTALPDGYDVTKLTRVEKAFAKPGVLKLVFYLPPETSNDVLIESHLLLYLPHRGNIPITNYTIHIRDLFTGRVILHQFLAIHKSGWYKVSLNRWPAQRLGLIAANHGLSIRLRHGAGKSFDFEEFYNRNENFAPKLLPALLAYHKYNKPKTLKDFGMKSEFLFEDEDEDSGNVASKLPANPRRVKRSSGSTSCSYTIRRVFLNFTGGTLLSPGNYTTKVCHGSCTSSRSTSSSCVPSKTQSFAVLFMDNNTNFILKTIPNAVVKECACPSSIGKNG